MLEEDPAFLQEVWALFGLGATVLMLRFAIRIKTVGIRGMQGDDFFSLLTLGFFTMDAATVHIIYYAGTNVEASALQKTRTLADAEMAIFEYGSKEQLAAWYSYTALIFCLKGTMICFFNRLTVGLWQHKFIKWLGLICVLSYMAVVLTITFGCFPTYKNWQVVPDPGEKCTLKLQNFLVTVILNVITDGLILAVPVPLLWKLQVPLKRKIAIALLLCSGLFVITAAIIRVVLTLGSNPSALNINRWGVRETIVGIVAVNLPILRPLINKSFWTRESFKSSSIVYGATHNLNENRGPYELSKSSELHKKHQNWSVGSSNHKSKSPDEESLERRGSTGGDSRELIIQDFGKSQGVVVDTTYEVSSEVADDERSSVAGQWRYGGTGAHIRNATTVHARTAD